MLERKYKNFNQIINQLEYGEYFLFFVSKFPLQDYDDSVYDEISDVLEEVLGNEPDFKRGNLKYFCTDDIDLKYTVYTYFTNFEDDESVKKYFDEQVTFAMMDFLVEESIFLWFEKLEEIPQYLHKIGYGDF